MPTPLLNSVLVLALLLQNMVTICAISHLDYGKAEPPHVHLSQSHSHSHSHGHSHGHCHHHRHTHESPGSNDHELPVNQDHEQDLIVVGEQLAILPGSTFGPDENAASSIEMDASLKLFQGLTQTAYFERLPKHLQAIYLQICALLL